MAFLRRHHPELQLDSPQATALHKDIIQTKKPLREWYLSQYLKYKQLVDAVPGGLHVEFGSGGGFLRQVCPDVVTTSVLESDVSGGLVMRRADAQHMPFGDFSLDSVFMLDVLHHLPEPRRFLSELDRCLKPGGKALFIEPASTLFSRFLYKNFHHEAFDEDMPGWEFPHQGHLSAANQAVPHIIFERDRTLFESAYPRLSLLEIKKHTFIAYLASGGLSHEQLLPALLWPAVKLAERAARPFSGLLAHHMDIYLEKKKA